MVAYAATSFATAAAIIYARKLAQNSNQEENNVACLTDTNTGNQSTNNSPNKRTRCY
jgi:hypothetical protein